MPDDSVKLYVEQRTLQERHESDGRYAKIIFERGFIAMISLAGLGMLGLFLKSNGII